MAIQKRFRFPCKEESYGQAMYAGVVVIQQHVLKFPTSARCRGARCARHARQARLEVPNLGPSRHACPASLARLAFEFWLVRIAFGSGSEVFLLPPDWRGHDYAG